jgi:hypothetical protein
MEENKMDILEIMKERHSVRAYTEKKIEGEILEKLQNKIEELNKESGLNMQLILDEPKAFDSFMAHYGKFDGVRNYIAIIGNKDSSLAEKAGYYGEQLVLFSQSLGLNTCWVALTFKKIKDAYKINKNEKMQLVIVIGYGLTQGVSHKTKTYEQVTNIKGEAPKWFIDGVNAALLAPTAVNQQKFKIHYNDGKVKITASKWPYANVDLGIVKCHFEIGSGKKFNKDGIIYE